MHTITKSIQTKLTSVAQFVIRWTQENEKEMSDKEKDNFVSMLLKINSGMFGEDNIVTMASIWDEFLETRLVDDHEIDITVRLVLEEEPKMFKKMIEITEYFEQ